MKKLVIAAAAVALAFGAQAASVSWKTGTMIKAPTSATDGTFSTANAGTGTLNMFVWIVDAATYNSTSLDAITSLDTSKATSKSGSGAAGITVTTSHDPYDATTNPTGWKTGQDNPVYALILTTYKSGDIEGYITNKATGNINGSGTGTGANNLAKNLGGTGTAIAGWAVPEPTSGILMLVGLGALALRRRRA